MYLDKATTTLTRANNNKGRNSKMNFSLKSKSHRRNSKQFLPTVVNSDDIEVLTDEDLMENIVKLSKERSQVFEERADTRPWDEELCYFRRELQLRRKRRELHDEYEKKLSEELQELYKQEELLPRADIDNTQFVVLYQQYRSN